MEFREDVQMIDTAKFFKEKKYVLIKEMIPKDIAKVATQYSHYDRASNFRPESEGAQIPGSHSVFMVTHLWKHF